MSGLILIETPEGGKAGVAFAPASHVTLIRGSLPGLSPAQARAAARLLVAERALDDIEILHVAVGDEEAGGERWIAWCRNADMAQWLAASEADVIIPAALAVAAPQEGFHRFNLNGEAVLRGKGLATLDDPAIAPLLTEGADVGTLSVREIEDAVEATLADPPLNLRQGAFAPRRGWQFDARMGKRLVVLAGALTLLTLAVPVAQLVRLNRESTRLEEQALALEQNALGGESAAARLLALRGPGAGFAATMRGVQAAIQATPNTELSSASFGPDGALSVNVRANAPGELDALRARLIAAGFDVTAGPVSGGSAPSQALGIQGR